MDCMVLGSTNVYKGTFC